MSSPQRYAALLLSLSLALGALASLGVPADASARTVAASAAGARAPLHVLRVAAGRPGVSRVRFDSPVTIDWSRLRTSRPSSFDLYLEPVTGDPFHGSGVLLTSLPHDPSLRIVLPLSRNDLVAARYHSTSRAHLAGFRVKLAPGVYRLHVAATESTEISLPVRGLHHDLTMTGARRPRPAPQDRLDSRALHVVAQHGHLRRSSASLAMPAPGPRRISIADLATEKTYTASGPGSGEDDDGALCLSTFPPAAQCEAVNQEDQDSVAGAGHAASADRPGHDHDDEAVYVHGSLRRGTSAQTYSQTYEPTIRQRLFAITITM